MNPIAFIALAFVVFTTFAIYNDTKVTEEHRVECEAKGYDWIQISRGHLCVKPGTILNFQ